MCWRRAATQRRFASGCERRDASPRYDAEVERRVDICDADRHRRRVGDLLRRQLVGVDALHVLRQRHGAGDELIVARERVEVGVQIARRLIAIVGILLQAAHDDRVERTPDRTAGGRAATAPALR